MSYSLETIINYINGKHLTAEERTQLEDNREFMIDAIKYSKDMKLYNLASNRLKHDYQFVIFIIKFFQYDLFFISEVAEKYIGEFTFDDDKKVEISILLSDLNKNRCTIFDINTFLFYQFAKELINRYLVEIRQKEAIDLGLGFIIIQHLYGKNKTILDFFARMFINEIFCESGDYASLEALMHHLLKTKEDLRYACTNTYLISYLKKKDEALANYTMTHTSLLTKLKKNIQTLDKTWDLYEAGRLDEKIEAYLSGVDEYTSSQHSILDSLDIILYVAKKYHIQPLLDLFNVPLDSIRNLETPSHITLDVQSYKCLQYALDLAHKIFMQDIIPIDDYDEETPNKGCVILKVDFKKRTNNVN